MLCHSMPCIITVYCDIIYRSMLCHTVPCYSLLHYAVLYDNKLCLVSLNYTIQHSTCYTGLGNCVLFYIHHFTILYYTILCYAILSYFTTYNDTFHYAISLWHTLPFHAIHHHTMLCLSASCYDIVVQYYAMLWYAVSCGIWNVGLHSNLRYCASLTSSVWSYPSMTPIIMVLPGKYH